MEEVLTLREIVKALEAENLKLCQSKQESSENAERLEKRCDLYIKREQVLESKFELTKSTLQSVERSSKDLEKLLAWKEDELIAAKQEVKSKEKAINDNTMAFSQLFKGLLQNLTEVVKDNQGNNQIIAENDQQWDKDFREIQDRLTDKERVYVNNALLTVEDKIGFIYKYLDYRKVDYLHTNLEAKESKSKFYEKLSKTQKYIKKLKMENESIISDLYRQTCNLNQEKYELQKCHAEQISRYEEEISDMNNKFHFFNAIHKELVSRYKALKDSVDAGTEKKNVGKYRGDIYTKQGSPPSQHTEELNHLKFQVDNLTNSKKANEKLKKELKLEIKELYDEKMKIQYDLIEALDKWTC